MNCTLRNTTQNYFFCFVEFGVVYGEESQGMHFGASKVQLSLHTGIQYLADDKVGKASVKSFATVSSCLDHGAHAIWAHLTPVLSRLAQSHPEVDTIHFVSDGPTAQY